MTKTFGAKHKARGAILRCDVNGIVVSMENQGLFEEDFPITGRLFGTLFSSTSVEKALSVQMELFSGHSVFTQELNVQVADDTLQTVFVSGYKEENTSVFLLSPAPEELFDLYAELMKINNDQANFIRTLSKRQYVPRQDEDSILKEFSTLNNEVANAQRELTKKNHTLNMLNLELTELNAEKDKLFSIIAHDLRSPFNALLGFSSLLEMRAQELDRSKVALYASHIHQSGQKLFKLLENLLEWARVQMGRVHPSPKSFVLADIIHRCLDALNASAETKHIKMTSTLSGEQAFADPNMIETVIRNLISNAIKFTQAGGAITVHATLQHDIVKISVSDTGVGIPENRLENLFKMSGAKSTDGTNGESGTGLGLILCKELVERNGGKIGVSSASGKGTTFYFTIPAAE
ncbi:hypothetical protein JCM17960_26270 [Magnetospira thiophila]